ncbi:MAG: hypothetical protein R3E53_16990 [Myxococcota bacterium]
MKTIRSPLRRARATSRSRRVASTILSRRCAALQAPRLRASAPRARAHEVVPAALEEQPEYLEGLIALGTAEASVAMGSASTDGSESLDLEVGADEPALRARQEAPHEGQGLEDLVRSPEEEDADDGLDPTRLLVRVDRRVREDAERAFDLEVRDVG